MITLNSCPVCKNYKIIPYRQLGIAPVVSHEIMPGVFINAGIISHYFECQDCHVIFQNPRMSDEELDKFYEEDYYRRLLNLTDKERDEDEMNRAEFDSKIIKEHLGEIESHLDIGCSRGFLLDKVAAKFKTGVETSINQVIVTGVEVYTTIDQILKAQKTFDLITMIHTLEHVPYPIDYLENIVKLVKKDGYLIIEVPTWKSPGGPLRLPHLFHFEPDVLKLICQRVGLKVSHVQFTPHLMLICRVGLSNVT